MSLRPTCLSLVLLATLTPRAPAPLVVERLHGVKAGEHVYAYARISPTGDFLAFASQTEASMGTPIAPIVKVVNLARKEVVFTEPGYDPYWSTDGRRLVYVSQRDGKAELSFRDNVTGRIARGIAPIELGGYPSIGKRNDRDFIVTIKGFYFEVPPEAAELRPNRMQPCPGIGTGVRPLVSKNGVRVSVFAGNQIVVRNVHDCRDIIHTGVSGAKADFSWDGRYLAFHAPKPDLSGYDIHVFDLVSRSIRRLDVGRGSSYFPSWTRDDRLAFRYEGAEYRGFLMASNIWSIKPEDPTNPKEVSATNPVTWSQFTNEPEHSRVEVVTVWAPWTPYSLGALKATEVLQRRQTAGGQAIFAAVATEFGTRQQDAAEFIRLAGIKVRQLQVSRQSLARTAAVNQIPTTLLFNNGRLVAEELGAMTSDEMQEWVRRTLDSVGR